MSRVLTSSATAVAAFALALTTMSGSASADGGWSLPTTTDNAPTCNVTTVGGDDVTGIYPNSRIALNNGEVTGQIMVTGESNCKVNVTLTTWTAPNSFDGKPYDQQKVFETKTLQFSVGNHDITVHAPNCYFQADLVRGDAAAGYNGTPIYEDGRMMASLHAGTHSCTPVQPDQPGQDSGTPPTVTPVSPVSVPTTPVVPPTTPPAPVTTPVSEPTPVSTEPSAPISPAAPGKGAGSIAAPVTTTPVVTPVVTPATTLPVTGASNELPLLAMLAGIAGAMVRREQLRRR